jgi:hypothetical protein
MTEYQPKPQHPEEVADGLRNAFRQAIQDGVIDATPYLEHMTSNKEIELLKQEIKVLQSKLALLEEIEKHNDKPKMTLENEGEFSLVCYDGYVYCRLEYPTDVIWYSKSMVGRMEPIKDIKTKNELESVWLVNDVKYQNDDEPYCPDEPEYYDEVEWDEKDNPKPKTIRSIIDRWWMDTFTTHSKWDAEECMDDLADQIEFWILRNKK